MRVLAISLYPDDEMLGWGSTLLKHPDATISIQYAKGFALMRYLYGEVIAVGRRPENCGAVEEHNSKWEIDEPAIL